MVNHRIVGHPNFRRTCSIGGWCCHSMLLKYIMIADNICSKKQSLHVFRISGVLEDTTCIFMTGCLYIYIIIYIYISQSIPMIFLQYSVTKWGPQTIAKLTTYSSFGFLRFIKQHLQNGGLHIACLFRPLGIPGFPGTSQNQQLKSSSTGWNRNGHTGTDCKSGILV